MLTDFHLDDLSELSHMALRRKIEHHKYCTLYYCYYY